MIIYLSIEVPYDLTKSSRVMFALGPVILRRGLVMPLSEDTRVPPFGRSPPRPETGILELLLTFQALSGPPALSKPPPGPFLLRQWRDRESEPIPVHC